VIYSITKISSVYFQKDYFMIQFGSTPLLEAVENENVNIQLSKVLRNRRKENTQVCELLLSRGADVNHKDMVCKI
jgi:hypothetical protein